MKINKILRILNNHYNYRSIDTHSQVYVDDIFYFVLMGIDKNFNIGFIINTDHGCVICKKICEFDFDNKFYKKCDNIFSLCLLNLNIYESLVEYISPLFDNNISALSC